VTSLSTFVWRSFLKLGGRVARLMLPTAVAENPLRPIANHRPASPATAIRWISHDGLDCETARRQANDNQPLAMQRAATRRNIGPALDARRPAWTVPTAIASPGMRSIRQQAAREIGRILVDDPIGPCASSTDRAEGRDAIRRRLACRPNPAAVSTADEIAGDETATFTQEGA
jgi:hypothetical protein